MSLQPIPVMWPKLASLDQAAPYLRKIDERRIYSNRGPLVQLLESRFAELIGCAPEQVVACASATTALTGMASLANSRVAMMPGISFVATYSSVAAAGKNLVVRDVDPLVGAQTVPSTLAEGNPGDFVEVVVAPFGQEVKHILSTDFGERELIIDAAASIDALFTDPTPLKENVSIAVSLHATKTLGVGEGGLAIFGNPERADEFRRWISFGFGDERQVISLGVNGKLSEISAAYGLAALDSWEETRHRWISIANRQRDISESLAIPSISSSIQFANPYWIIQFPEKRARIHAEMVLRRYGIETRQWWPQEASEILPALAIGKRATISEQLQKASHFAKVHLGLPKFLDIEERQFGRIYDALHEIFRPHQA